MGAKHVLRPKSHQRSLSYALNTSKLGDETVAFKFYGRCKQGLLTSPGWSAPWSEELLLLRRCHSVDRANRLGAGADHPGPESLHVAGHIWSPWIWEGSWAQTGHRQTSTSRLSGFRRPQQDMSKACVCPIWKQIHWQRRVKGPKPDVHPTEWPEHCTAPDRPETDPIASSKDPKRSCQSSFSGVHSSQHLMWFTGPCFFRHFSLKCETSKGLVLLRRLD